MTGPGSAPLRVGFMIDQLAPGAGTENQLLFLLADLPRTEVEPHLACLREPTPENPDYPKIVLGLSRFPSAPAVPALTRLKAWIRNHRLDLMVTFFRDSNLMGTFAARWAGVPVVGSRRNLGYWHARRSLTMLRLANRWTGHFVANSIQARDQAIAVEGLSVDRFSVIPNAVDTNRFSPGPSRRGALGLPAGPLMLCLANLRSIKGIDVLLQAMSKPALSSLGARVAIVGSGPEEVALKHSADQLGVSERVLWMGPRHDVPDLLRSVDLGVLPSRSESLSNAVLEYMAAGLPVVATAVGATPELLAGGKAGRLVPAEDADALAREVARLMEDQGERERLGEAARERVVSTYGRAQVLDQWIEFFRSRRVR